MERKQIIADLKKAGAVEVKDVKIQSVSFKEVEDYERVCLTVSPEVDAYVSDDKGGFVKGKTNKIFTFPSILRALFAEDDALASIRKVVIDNELICGLVLDGATINVLCQSVAGDEVYHNPFVTSTAKDKAYGHDTIIHHITSIKLSNAGYDEVKDIKSEIRRSTLALRKK